MRKVYVGTSGWNYEHWKKVFYPEGLPSSKWLDHYMQYFDTVELNVTFYRLVPKTTFELWYRKSPKDFRFVAKGSRFITHIKKLNAVEEPLDLYLQNALALKEKLLAILWQFPPHLKKDPKKLEVFLKLLERKTKVRQVFEFRHETWFDAEVYGLLKQYNACLCIACITTSKIHPCVKESTADFLYLRFHGDVLYRSNYKDATLREWANFAHQHKGKDVLAYFNNDAEGFAIPNALKFKEMLEEH